ncbi:hypothetical protein ACFL2Q_01890 [Thermodesulfobacteriota bacterium]
MKKKGQKERLKPLSFYGHDPRDVIRAFMQINPEELKRLEEEELRQHEIESQENDEFGGHEG